MRFNIKTKLLTSFSAVLLMVAATGGIGIYELGKSNDRMTDFVTGSFKRVDELGALNDRVAQSGRLISNVILSSDAAAMGSMRAAYEATTNDYRAKLTAYAALLPPGRAGELDEIAAIAQSIDAVGRQAMDLAQRNDVVKATALSRGEGSAIGNRLGVSLASLRDELVWLDGPQQAQAVSSQLGGDIPNVWRMVITSLAETDGGELDRLGEEVHHQIKAVDDKLAVIDASLKVAQLDVPALPRVHRLWTEFKPVAEQLLGFGMSDASYHAAQLQQSKIVPAFETLGAKLAAMTAREEASARQSAAETATSYVLTRNMLIALVAGSIAISVLAGVLLLRSVGHPIVVMTKIMTKLASGDHDVEVPAKHRKDEIGSMAMAVQGFKDAGVEKLRLEREAVETRRRVEAERSRNEAARAAAAERQAMVVEAVASGLEQLADGNLVFRLENPFDPEYEKLRTDFNGAMHKLQQTMTLVTNNTAALRSGSSEISTAADDLSKRTEQQAASLEETAAALDEITTTVKKTADGAGHARQVVSTAKTDAEHSGEVVGQAVQAMTAIETSSQQVTQIIGVIDEIAFQTNLLALNAGVEAARAGEAGRGFAVVASEVRALAQRSAEAAKEIKALISTSSAQVKEGVSLVDETGKSLGRIVARIAEINAIVTEIAASAQEQATGLEQVNTAINQMDQVTQQNAAMVEQSTAASHGLAHETEELARLIGQFRTGGAGAPRDGIARWDASPSPAPRRVTALKTVGGGGAARKAAPQADEAWEEF